MYYDLSDEDLIKAFLKNNDEYAQLSLVNRYRRKAFYYAKYFYSEHKNTGISLDDYYSVTLSSIITAVRKFNTNKGVKFSSFYFKIALNALKTYDEENSYFKEGKTFAGSISLDDGHKDGGMSYAEEFGDIDPIIEKNIDLGELKDAYIKAYRVLSPKQRKVHAYILNGLSHKEIASKLKMPLSSVYDVEKKVLSKLKSIYKK